MRIALVVPRNPDAAGAMNKDLNGGFGTHNDFGTSRIVRRMRRATKNKVVLPVLMMAKAHAVLERLGHRVTQCDDGELLCETFDTIFVYGSIVDYPYELDYIASLRHANPDAKIYIVGPFPWARNTLFLGFGADGIRSTPLHDFSPVPGNLDAFPCPVPANYAAPYSYYPALPRNPFYILEASRGCPYKCADYCTYGAIQGPKVGYRSPNLVAEDMAKLADLYGIKSIQFRDPLFGLHSEWLRRFCLELAQKELDIDWGIETRMDAVRPSQIRMMAEVGLKNINAGFDRQPPHGQELENLELCRDLDINVSAFHVIGRPDDTEETIERTIRHAIDLNTPLARFAVFTPYPGTKVYRRMQLHGQLLGRPLYEHTQFNLVYDHPHFTPERMDEILDSAYRRYYLRAGYVWRNLA